MKNELLRRMRGELEIEISGELPQRLLNLAQRQGLIFRDIRFVSSERLRARIALADVYRLRPLMRPCRCRLRICRRIGLPFTLAFLRRRPLLPLGALLAIGLLVFVNSLIFEIEVGGPYPLSEQRVAQILQLAEQQGLKSGACVWRLDLQQIERQIADNAAQISFAEIYRCGNNVYIEVVERDGLSADEQPLPAGDIVAACDGLIIDVLVRQGTAAVQSGDAVTAGQVLIYGYQGQRRLAASGIVNAEVYGRGYGECALSGTAERYTGRSCKNLAVRVNDGALLLIAGADPAPYQLYDTERRSRRLSLGRNKPLSVEFVVSKICEKEQYTLRRSADEAAAIAAEAATAAARAALPEQANLSDTQLTEILLEDDLRRMQAVLTATAEIGVFRAAE